MTKGSALGLVICPNSSFLELLTICTCLQVCALSYVHRSDQTYLLRPLTIRVNEKETRTVHSLHFSHPIKSGHGGSVMNEIHAGKSARPFLKMDFLRAVCDNHHDNFYALMGLTPKKRVKKVLPKPKKKVTQKRYKLNTRSIHRKPVQKNSRPNPPPAAPVESSNNEIKVSIKEELIESPAEAAPLETEQETSISPLSPKEVPGVAAVAASRVQKNFFHIVCHQTTSNLKRFLRTNSGQIEINSPLLDKKSEKKGGPFCGWTALHIASFRGLLDMISLLFEYGANVNEKASLQSEVRYICLGMIYHSFLVVSRLL